MDDYTRLTQDEKALVEFAVSMFFWEGRHRGIPINFKGEDANRQEKAVNDALARWLIESRPQPKV